MAYEIPGFSYTLPAGQDFRTGAGQFRFVNVNTTGKAVVPTLGGAVVGVRQNKPNTNEACTIVQSGIVFVEASAIIALGAEVTTTADGRAVTSTTGNRVHGVALEAASGAGVQIAVLLQQRSATTP